MFKKILIALVAVVAVFFALVATRPAAFQVQRAAMIAAPPEVAYAMVNDFHSWELWSPWEKRDPTLKKTFGGPSSGAGAVYSWAGTKDVGEGRMTIVSTRPSEAIDIKLEFLKPFEATNRTLFTFKPVGAGTEVTWTMTGNNAFMGKAMSVFMDMDRMIGKDFEAGLTNMKTVAEAKVAATKAAPAAAAAAAPVAPAPATAAGGSGTGGEPTKAPAH